MTNQEKVSFIQALLPGLYFEVALEMYQNYENYLKEGYPRFQARARAGIYGQEDDLAA